MYRMHCYLLWLLDIQLEYYITASYRHRTVENKLGGSTKTFGPMSQLLSIHVERLRLPEFFGPTEDHQKSCRYPFQMERRRLQRTKATISKI